MTHRYNLVIVSLSLLLMQSIGCKTGNKRAGYRYVSVDDFAEASLDDVPYFPDDNPVDPTADTLREKLAGCTTSDGEIFVCPGVIAEIFDGNQFQAQVQRLTSYGDIGPADDDANRSTNGRYQKRDVTFDNGQRLLVLTRIQAPAATVFCRIQDDFGARVCLALVTATADFGRTEVNRVIAGNFNFLSRKFIVDDNCVRRDVPGKINITCADGSTMTIGRVDSDVSETGMRVMLANLADRYRRQAREAGTSTSGGVDEATCQLSHYPAKCKEVKAQLGVTQRTSVFAVVPTNGLYLVCTFADEVQPKTCDTLLQWKR